MSNIYERLGARTIINATGSTTRMSGALVHEEVVAAMAEAAQYCVDMEALQARAGEIIAELTGAQAGYVTAGAAAGLLLGTAACVTGLDPVKMNQLPDMTGMKDEVIIPRSHRNFYDHAIRATGVKLVEVGIPDRFSGAGVRDTEAWEIAAAIGERTAAVAYVANMNARPKLSEVVAAAHAKGVPVIVDAAAQLPPAANLQRFITEGADLVCFSGGKAIGGPQASGILCGRRELVSAAALQHLDQDVLFEFWDPPKSLIDKDQLPGGPQHGIGRPCKVGKEQIVGLIVALERFVAEGDEARRARWQAQVDELVAALGELEHAKMTAIVHPTRPIPMARLQVDEEQVNVGAVELAKRLTANDPAIHVKTSEAEKGALLFDPTCLRPGDVERIARGVHHALAMGQ